MPQLEIFLVVIVVIVAVSATLYIALSRRKEDETLAQETVMQESGEKPEVAAPRIGLELTSIRGIGPKWSERLKGADINTVDDLVGYSDEELAKKVGVSESIASRWIKNANEVLLLEFMKRNR